MGDIDKALEALEALTDYAAESAPNTGLCLHDSEIVRQALERQPERYEQALRHLRRIAYMGGDCPAEMEPEAFYRGQLYNCISLAARALSEANDG